MSSDQQCRQLQQPLVDVWGGLNHVNVNSAVREWRNITWSRVFAQMGTLWTSAVGDWISEDNKLIRR